MSISADFIAKATGGKWVNQELFKQAQSFCIDSRKLKKNEAFIAIKTPSLDGSKFIESAFEKGACFWITQNKDFLNYKKQTGAILVVEDTILAIQSLAKKYRQLFCFPIIGITGSCGKTSTREILSCLLSDEKNEKTLCKTKGNFNNTIGLNLCLLELEKENLFGIFEAGISLEGEMDILQNCLCPNVGILTNIENAHLEGLKNKENIAFEKTKLFKDTDFFVTHNCLLEFKAIKNLENKIIFASDINEENSCESHFKYDINFDDTQNISIISIFDKNKVLIGKFELSSPSIGMAKNAVLAIIMALKLGININQIKENLPKFKHQENRGNIIQKENLLIFSDCYNANSSSMIDSLKSFCKITKNKNAKRLYIIGSMGELGENAKNLHLEILPFIEENSQIIFLGQFAQTLFNGIDKNKYEKVLIANNNDEILSIIKNFKGSVFVKGSHSNNLEEIIKKC